MDWQLVASCFTVKSTDNFYSVGKLPVPAGASYNCITVGQGPTALAVGAGGGCLDIFTLIYPFFPLSPSLGRRPDID